MDTRVSNAWKRFWAPKEVMKGKIFSVKTKRKVINICNLLYLTCGCQTWALSQKKPPEAEDMLKRHENKHDKSYTKR